MIFAVVQWLEENSVSVINEEQVILGEDLELKEGLTVDVSAGKNSKGRLAVYKATVLKLFGELNLSSLILYKVNPLYSDKRFWMNFIITNHTLVGLWVMVWFNTSCDPKQTWKIRLCSHIWSNETNIAVTSDSRPIFWQKSHLGSHSVHEFDLSPACFTSLTCFELNGNPCSNLWEVFVLSYILLCFLHYLNVPLTF